MTLLDMAVVMKGTRLGSFPEHQNPGSGMLGLARDDDGIGIGAAAFRTSLNVLPLDFAELDRVVRKFE